MISLSVIAFSFLLCALAASHPLSHTDPIHVPVLRRSNVSDRVANLPEALNAIKHKYGAATANVKRSGGANPSYIPLSDHVCHFRSPALR